MKKWLIITILRCLVVPCMLMTFMSCTGDDLDLDITQDGQNNVQDNDCNRSNW